MRWAPREKIAAEVAWVVEHGYPSVNLCDTAINHETSKLRELCEAIAEGDPRRKLRCSAFLRHDELVTSSSALSRSTLHRDPKAKVKEAQKAPRALAE